MAYRRVQNRGPLMFWMIINDSTGCFRSSHHVTFGDDIKVNIVLRPLADVALSN